LNNVNEKVILVTGASSGIGRACAERLAHLGHRVYGTSRRAPFPPAPAPPGAPTMLPLDVDQDESVQRAVSFIIEQAGRLDVVVNNAGFGIGGALEDCSIEEARALFETNFFGVLRVCRAALPVMRQQGGGTIINISSLGGIIALPFQALYSASKFAVEGLSEALRMEVQPLGIHVVLVEPGDTRTGFTDARRKSPATPQNPAYAEACARALKVAESDERSGASPEQVARVVERIVHQRSPRPRYRVGPAFQKLAVVLKSILPNRLFLWALSKYYRL